MADCPSSSGMDSSTQSTKAVLVDADDGTVVDQRTAAHPPGTSVDPRAWIEALDAAPPAALLDRAEAVAVGGQQHGSVVLDEAGEPVRDALLWNDLRSAGAADDLVAELGGPDACAELTGSVLQRVVHRDQAALAARPRARGGRAGPPRAAAARLPHLAPRRPRPEPTTDRGDASGTGYFSTRDDDWLPDVLERALGRVVELPRVAAARRGGGTPRRGRRSVPAPATTWPPPSGSAWATGDVAVSIGTSGVASMVTSDPIADGTGAISGFADATGRFLPLACTINAARILELGARLLGVDHDGLAALAQESVPGAHGLTLLPYLDGERTPSRPDAAGTLHGLTTATTRADLARAHVEGLLFSLADAVDALAEVSGRAPDRLLLIGGAARNPAVLALAPLVFEAPGRAPATRRVRRPGRRATGRLGALRAPPLHPTGPCPPTDLPTGQTVRDLRDDYAAPARPHHQLDTASTTRKALR